MSILLRHYHTSLDKKNETQIDLPPIRDDVETGILKTITRILRCDRVTITAGVGRASTIFDVEDSVHFASIPRKQDAWGCDSILLPNDRPVVVGGFIDWVSSGGTLFDYNAFYREDDGTRLTDTLFELYLFARRYGVTEAAATVTRALLAYLPAALEDEGYRVSYATLEAVFDEAGPDDCLVHSICELLLAPRTRSLRLNHLRSLVHEAPNLAAHLLEIALCERDENLGDGEGELEG